MVAFVVVVSLWVPRVGAAEDHKDGENGVAHHAPITIASLKTGADYPIGIYVPPSYANGTALYPVIYITDGDAPFPPDGRFANFKKILERRHIDAILVGIGGTARRNTDFVLPGARAYHAFITQELIPFIELQFRADPKRRVLSGISLGGSFALTSLFLEAPDRLYFADYISAEGSFYQPTFIALEKQFSDTVGTKSIPATVILARGSQNTTSDAVFPSSVGGKSLAASANLVRGYSREGTNSSDVDALYHRMDAHHYTDLTLVEMHFPTDHIGTDNPSFEDAIVRILGTEKSD